MAEFDPFGIFGQFLEEDPLGRRAAFFGQPGVQGGGFNQQRFFGNLFPQVENRFLGQLGSQILGGGEPTAQFTDFLGQQNFGREFLRAPTFQTGRQKQGLVSPTRFLFQR